MTVKAYAAKTAKGMLERYNYEAGPLGAQDVEIQVTHCGICQAEFAVPIPDELPSGNAGPLMCAGATVFTPMVEYDVMPWMRTAVVGIGGLGHLAVQFLAKFGCEVTAISSSHDKNEDARKLGAARFIATKGTDEPGRLPRSTSTTGAARHRRRS